MRTFFSHAKTHRRAAWQLCLVLLLAATAAFAQAGRIYTAPDPAATGGITGRASEELTHAIAIEHDRVRVYRADLNDSGRAFRFEHLPIGKYDLVLFSKSGSIGEGLALGAPASLPAPSAHNLETRIATADGFFNHSVVHRTGIDPTGDTLLAFVERYRANNVLKQNADALGQMVRRFEVIELTRATDDWQMTNTRHIYREGEPIPDTPQFRKTVQLPSLGGVRIIQTVKDLGEIALPK